MIELHLIGYTSDLRYLVVEIAGVDGGDEAVRYRLPVDADLLLTLDEIRTSRRDAGFDDPPPPPIEPEGVRVPTDRPLFGPAGSGRGPGRVPGREPERTEAPGAHGTGEPEETEADDPAADDPAAEARSSTEAGAGEGSTREAPAPDGESAGDAREPDDVATSGGDPADDAPDRDDAVTPDGDPADDEPAADDDGDADDGDAAVEPEGSPDAEERVESRLSPAEIQSMLREGTSPRTVADRAGTEVAWVERWLPPILAERRQVLEEAQGMRLERPRLGASRQPLGQAVMSNLRSKRVDPDDVRWTAKRRMDGSWTVSVRYRGRGRWRTASWRLDRAQNRLSPASDLARELGFARARRRGR